MTSHRLYLLLTIKQAVSELLPRDVHESTKPVSMKSIHRRQQASPGLFKRCCVTFHGEVAIWMPWVF